MSAESSTKSGNSDAAPKVVIRYSLAYELPAGTLNFMSWDAGEGPKVIEWQEATSIHHLLLRILSKRSSYTINHNY